MLKVWDFLMSFEAIWTPWQSPGMYGEPFEGASVWVLNASLSVFHVFGGQLSRAQ